jgi:thymidylate synthase (FAD)
MTSRDSTQGRPSVQELDAMLGKPFPVLDNGFVRVIDYMGTDASIVQAARVSYGEGTKKLHEDRGLIRYLMRHHHTTPFEMCELKLHVRVPMDCWRQWIRHRTANVNEYSTRYSVAIDAASTTSPSNWRLQAKGNKQGSAGQLDAERGSHFSDEEAAFHRQARTLYEQRLAAGIAREQARKDLPLSTYTEAYWKIDLHNLFHFLALRLADVAQYEIREYARLIGYNIVNKWCPTAWEAFLDYRLRSMTLSRLEVAVIRALIRGDHEEALALCVQSGLVSDRSTSTRNRERQELELKLESLGLPFPWLSLAPTLPSAPST